MTTTDERNEIRKLQALLGHANKQLGIMTGEYSRLAAASNRLAIYLVNHRRESYFKWCDDHEAGDLFDADAIAGLVIDIMEGER